MAERDDDRWVDLRDGIAVAGLALVGIGLWLVYPPAAFAVPGAALFWLAARR